MIRTRPLAALLLLITLVAVPALAADSTLDELATHMTGVFTSAEQAKADPEAFRDVRLVMVPIWTEREDGPWLYVEQAVAEALERPYRQRVYHLRTTDGRIESVVYTLPGDPLEHAAAWTHDTPLGVLTPDDLVERAGCEIRLSADDNGWAGSTVDKNCPSSLRGASYATSEVEISAGLLVSWDRGYDADDNQVWGAEKGGYHFVKVAEEP